MVGINTHLHFNKLSCAIFLPRPTTNILICAYMEDLTKVPKYHVARYPIQQRNKVATYQGSKAPRYQGTKAPVSREMQGTRYHTKVPCSPRQQDKVARQQGSKAAIAVARQRQRTTYRSSKEQVATHQGTKAIITKVPR